MKQKNMRNYMKNKFLIIIFLIGVSQFVCASELVYRPVNPSFGGSPLNGNFLLSSAQAQNDIKDPDLDDEAEKSPLEEFNDRLQRSLLSRLTSTLSNSFVDGDGKLVPGTMSLS